MWWPDLYKIVTMPNVEQVSDVLLGRSYCVASCPKNITSTSKCFLDNKTISEGASCPLTFYSSYKYIGRYCLPDLTNMTKVTQKLLGKIADSDAGRYMGDLATAWWVLLVVGFISTTIAFAYLFLLKWFARPIIFISFAAILILLIGGGFYVYYSSARYEMGDNTEKVMKGLGIMIWILAGIYACLLACCYRRIQLAISIVDAASDFVGTTPRVFAIPFVFFFFSASFIIWWVISAIWVFSVGEVEYSGSIIANIKWNTTTRYVWIYHLFGLFWISAFIIGCSQFLVAAVCSLWYFSYGAKSDDHGHRNMVTAWGWLTKYHVGSVAFGSLIIAIMEMIKVIFEYIRRKYADLIGKNLIMKVIVCCVRCCIWCLDYCVKHITKNAYIQIALTGNSFCQAAWQTFWLVVRNAGRFSVVTGIGNLLMFIGKAVNIVVSGWIAYLILMNEKNLKENVQSPIFPVIVVVFIAYLLSSVFISLFSFSATTILHCFIVDSELSTQKGRSNAHTPQSLQPFLEKNEQMMIKEANQGIKDTTGIDLKVN